MTCKAVKEYTEEYAKLEEEIQDICKDRACTLEAILKTLAERGIEVKPAALIEKICQIKGMIIFEKYPTYDIEGTITYKDTWLLDWLFSLFSSEKIGNLIVMVKYKKFYLYNPDRYSDRAFYEHIRSKLEFEKDRREEITRPDNLKRALESLNIPREKFENYVCIENGKVYYWIPDKDDDYYKSKHEGKLVEKFTSK